MEQNQPETKPEVHQQQPEEPQQETNKLSKNEQKRLEKQKKLEAEKAEKAAKKAKEAEGKEKKPKEEEILDPTAYFENRSKMITELKKNPNTYPYPHKFHVQLTVHQFINKYAPLTQNGQWLEENVSIAGRVTNIRHQGKKLVFYDIRQEGERLQVMCNSNNHKGNRDFEELHSTIRRGDIIGIVGLPGRTNTS